MARLDRRALLLGALGGLIAACSRSQGQDRASAPAFQTDWAEFRGLFLQADGRVIDTGNNWISRSEGQGYAMVMAAEAGDQASFERMLAWTEETLGIRQDGLFAWRYDPSATTRVADRNNATDGDILIAWALMIGAERWSDQKLAARAAAIRATLRRTMIREAGGMALLLPGGVGFERLGGFTVNPSYYVWPALLRFAAADGAPTWQAVIEGGEALLKHARFGTHMLPTDWVGVGREGTMQRGGSPTRFDAIRIPLYRVMAGQAPPPAIVRYWQSEYAAGRTIPAWIDVHDGSTAPYPLSTGAMAVVARTLTLPLPPRQSPSDYYAAVLDTFARRL